MASIRNYVSNLNIDFRQTTTHFHKLSRISKAVTIFLSIFAAIPTLGLGFVPVFNYLVNRFKPLSTNDLSKPIEKIHQTSIQILEPVKPKPTEQCKEKAATTQLLEPVNIQLEPPVKKLPIVELPKETVPPQTPSVVLLETILPQQEQNETIDLTTALAVQTSEKDILRAVAKGEMNGEQPDFKFICKGEKLVHAHIKMLKKFSRNRKKYPIEKTDPNITSAFNVLNRDHVIKLETFEDTSVHFFLDLIYDVNRPFQESELKSALEATHISYNLGLPLLANKAKIAIQSLFKDHPKLILKALIMGFELNSLMLLDFLYSEQECLDKALFLNNDEQIEAKIEQCNDQFFSSFQKVVKPLLEAYNNNFTTLANVCQKKLHLLISLKPQLFLENLSRYYPYRTKLTDFLLNNLHYLPESITYAEQKMLYELFDNDKDSKEGKTGLALCYEKGYFVKKNLSKSLELLLSIKEDYPPALFKLGEYYETQNAIDKMTLYYAKAGHLAPLAIYRLGLYFLKDTYNQKSIDTKKEAAFKCFKAAANEGLILAFYHLGKCYLEGKGCSKDLKKAIRCFKQAARGGNLDANEALGHIFELGDPNQGVKANREMAVFNYTQSSITHPFSQYKLGYLYENAGDNQKAIHFYSLAASNLKEAKIGLDRLNLLDD